MFKEMKMKKRFVLTGLLSVLLIAGLIFTACPMDSGGGGSNGPSVDVPAAGDLPALPAGKTPVSSENEAKALLNALGTSGMLWTLRNNVEDVIEENTAGTETSGSWEFENVQKNGMKISSSGRYSYETNVTDEKNLKKGDYYKENGRQDTTVELIADKSGGSYSLVSGSIFAEGEESNEGVTLTEVDANGGTMRINGSQKAAYGYGLTFAYNNTAGKIILDASGGATFSGTISWGDEWPEPQITISGSLKVYGASDDTPVYSETITKDNYEVILGYFGLADD
jgi:hypothetical protein